MEIPCEVTGFEVKDFADGWIPFTRDEIELALKVMMEQGTVMRVVYGGGAK